MYYIEQTEGKLVDAAETVRQAIQDGDFERARQLYINAMGVDPQVEGQTWWKYCAYHHIVTNAGLTVEDYASFTGNTQEKRMHQAAALATRRVGGTWAVRYEY